MNPNALNPKAPPFNSNGPGQPSGGVNKVGAISINTSGTAHVPVQKSKVRNATGAPVEGLAMIDSGPNQTLVRRELAEKLGLVGETRRMKMHVAGGGVKIFAVKVFAIKKPCQGARTVSRSALIQFSHLVDIVDDLYVRGSPVDVLLGTDLPEVHHDYKVLAGDPGEPIAKKNIFGSLVLGRIEEEDAVGVILLRFWMKKRRTMISNDYCSRIKLELNPPNIVCVQKKRCANVPLSDKLKNQQKCWRMGE
jgi:hypothetical protein